jgi:DNA-binding XRE family transcriptional regulator
MPPNDAERLKLIRNEQGRISQQKLADRLGIASHKIKDIEVGKTKISTELALLIEANFHYSFKWILTGDGHPYIKGLDPVSGTSEPCAGYGPPSTPTTTGADVFEIEHMQLVKGFRDKRRALNINRELMDLEQLDAEEFKMMEAYIKGSVDMLRRSAERKKQEDRRQSDRRTQDDPGKAQDGPDRRSGSDRRKASGGN